MKWSKIFLTLDGNGNFLIEKHDCANRVPNSPIWRRIEISWFELDRIEIYWNKETLPSTRSIITFFNDNFDLLWFLVEIWLSKQCKNILCALTWYKRIFIRTMNGCQMPVVLNTYIFAQSKVVICRGVV